MKIQKSCEYNQTFGIRVPTKTAIEAASGCFLENASISYPRQCKLLEKLSGLDTKKLYSGELGEGLKNLSRHLRDSYPELAEAAANIKKHCNLVNADRTFYPEDELKIIQGLRKLWNEEANKIEKKYIDIPKIPLRILGLDKYNQI